MQFIVSLPDDQPGGNEINFNQPLLLCSFFNNPAFTLKNSTFNCFYLLFRSIRIIFVTEENNLT